MKSSLYTFHYVGRLLHQVKRPYTVGVYWILLLDVVRFVFFVYLKKKKRTIIYFFTPTGTQHTSWGMVQLVCCFQQQMRCYSAADSQAHAPTHTLTGMDGSANQWSHWSPVLGCELLSHSSVTHSELRSQWSVSAFHLHRKHCHRFHFSISLCIYMHLLIHPEYSDRPCKHAQCVRCMSATWRHWSEHVSRGWVTATFFLR